MIEKHKPLALVLACLCVCLPQACAAVGSSGAGDKDLPTSGVGPFRKLDGDETLGIAPFVLDDGAKEWKDPAVLPADPESGDARVILFAAGKVKNREVIVRTRAEDGRSFFGAETGKTPRIVLQAEDDAEQVQAPSAARIGGRIFLYWADGQGIRIAVSDDGLTFERRPGRALDMDSRAAWEKSPPSAPSVAVYPDGRVRMIYAAGGFFGEAESLDGFSFTRLGEDPIFGPSPERFASTAPGEKPLFDAARVDDPCLVPRVTPAGRLHIRVLYTATDAAGATAIGFASRYGDVGPLVRQAQPVYAVNKRERGPALLEWPGGALLYVSQVRQSTPDTKYFAIAAAVSPANLRLPRATTYADSP